MQEDIANYDTYQKHVQCIVKQWLMGKEHCQAQNPNYQQNSLTSFLLMVCISSFLEVAKDAAKQTYQKWKGQEPFWWEHDKYKATEELEMKKFCKHKRQGAVWNFLTSIGVTNFEPNQPGDIDGWQNWLSRKQLIEVMEFCFATFWKDKIEGKSDRRWVLRTHIEVYWGWFDHLWSVQTELKNLKTPYPSGWTWGGYMKKVKAGLAENAAETYRRKLGNCESLAKLYTHLFSKISMLSRPLMLTLTMKVPFLQMLFCTSRKLM